MEWWLDRRWFVRGCEFRLLRSLIGLVVRLFWWVRVLLMVTIVRVVVLGTSLGWSRFGTMVVTWFRQWGGLVMRRLNSWRVIAPLNGLLFVN